MYKTNSESTFIKKWRYKYHTSEYWKSGNGEMAELTIIIVIFAVLFVAITAMFQMTFSLDALTKAATAASRAAAVCDNRNDAENNAEQVVKDYFADKGEFKDSLSNYTVSFEDVANVFTFGKENPTEPMNGWKPGQIKKVTVSADVKTIEPYFISGRKSASYVVMVEGSNPMSGSDLQIASDNGKTIATYLKSNFNLSDAAIAGILANFYAESRYNPEAVNKSSGAIGIAQWLSPARVRGLKRTAAALNSTVTNLAVQLQYLKEEMDGYYKHSTTNRLEAIKSNSDAAAKEATRIWLVYFEGIAVTDSQYSGANGLAERQANAVRILHGQNPKG